MNQERKKELLGKFADRSLSPAEQEEFWEMMKLEQHDDLDLEFGFSELEVDPQEQQDSIAAVKNRLTGQIGKKKRSYKFLYKGIAAIAAVLLLIAGFKVYQDYKYVKNTNTFITVRVPVGKMQRVFLSDSSVVTVSSGSVFKYPKAFAKNSRVVYLSSGKAFFEVAKDRSRPFSVRSGELSTTALGTSFTVQYNAAYGWEKVNLYTGKVVISRRVNGGLAKPVYLTPGKAYEYIAGQGNVFGFDPSHQQPLTERNALHFAHTPFSEAIYQISSYYNIHIHFNPVQTRHYTVNGDFAGQSAEETLQSLVFIHQLKFTRSDSLNYSIMKK
eukprot:gene10534-12257_t